MIDTTDEESEDFDVQAAWLFVLRWSKAHEECRWIAPAGQPDVVDGKIVLGAMDLPEKEQSDVEDVETLDE
jgi:hypothetical protein